MNLEKLTILIGRSTDDLTTTTLPQQGGYLPAVLKREAVKSLLGSLLALGAVLILQPALVVTVFLMGIAAMFALYLAQQVRKAMTKAEVSEQGLRYLPGGGAREIKWEALEDFRLNYYPDGKKAKSGNLVLVLKSRGVRIKLDSALEIFPALIQRAAKAARACKLELHPTTQANLEQLEL